MVVWVLVKGGTLFDLSPKIQICGVTTDPKKARWFESLTSGRDKTLAIGFNTDRIDVLFHVFEQGFKPYKACFEHGVIASVHEASWEDVALNLNFYTADEPVFQPIYGAFSFAFVHIFAKDEDQAKQLAEEAYEKYKRRKNQNEL